MKKLAILPLVFLLAGCPGDRNISQQRYTYRNGEIICFSVDKKDTLTFYRIESNQGGAFHTILSKSNLKLSYPDTCIKPKLNYGYKYYISYGLNDKYYVDSFFINNDGK
jgi:hypothetical protein